MIIATVKTVSTTNGLKLLVDGETTTTEKYYKYISSYSPKVNDRVLVEKISGTYVVIGALLPK